MTTATTWNERAPIRADNVEIAPRISEDWLSLIVGLFIFVLSLAAIVNIDLLGWVVTTSVWTDVGKALGPVSKSYASLGGFGALLASYVALLVVLSAAAVALKSDIKRFALAFTAVFWIAYASWVAGNFANFAAVTPADLQKFGIGWSLRLTNEGAYIFALIAGLVIANVFPRFADAIKDAVRPELYIKIAIVILGGFFAVTAAGKLSLASSLLLRGVAAIIEAYLIYWAVVYFVARKWFGFNREWAAPLASGISICGVSAAIATGGAIRARPVVPVMVSSLVVIFAVVEVLVLPFLAQQHFLAHEPLVAGAWMALRLRPTVRRLPAPSPSLDPRAERGRRRQISAWLDARHRRRSRCSSTFSSAIWASCWLHLDRPHQPHVGQSEHPRDLGALPEIRARLRADVHRRPLPRAGDAGGHRDQGPGCDERGQHAARHVLHPDLLLDRRTVELQEALAGGHRTARRRLCREPVRLRDLGRTFDFVAVLRRRQAAAGQLSFGRTNNVATEYRRGTAQG
jgi:uncharacterized membrane protein YadS